MPLTNPAEDLALLADMRRGVATAFEALYRRHQGPLYRFALLRCGSADAAADLVQEVFLALLTDRLKFDPTRGALQSFLFGVVRNFVLKREDAESRFVHRRDDEEGEDDRVIDPAPQPVEALLADETAERVRHALRQLAPHYRDVAILYEMHELSYVEIAQICNIDIGTVRSRLSRARAKLAELLSDQIAKPHRATATNPESRQEARP
jgi:RNA polymerase sigma-70 factor, ECF subfamily